mmetsp:Transcript_7224/g.8283  ORF Transcript_7224/g.8283 Transcript_7224/m.8283 type:complete len:382 (-) Transcript_7224:323-1468(-)|eukprot:CAMPEP_0184015902 /NCGR_PEP_ID=MMETSP0954-20121128/6615_1 /TAXON_ID=627963 /ORGANISM="Aplanochytrium sp, Strain PBS07" /LENGTH=381 /DNA_ID=CAMNT_0026296831 /DNA_START=2221 /DNA_END=3366 /DNA_ORIENTATION=-
MAKCCGIFALVIALVLGGIFSGEFSRLGLVHFAVENLASSQRPIGVWPSTVDFSKKQWNYEAISPGELDGKIALVTGGNNGLGYYTSLHLALKGATTVVACRSPDKCKTACEKINQEVADFKSKGSAVPMIVDVSNFESVRKFSREFLKQFQILDIFVQNAGIVSGPALKLTSDGIEQTFHTNHFGHFQMTQCLKSAIEAATSKGIARIVAVSSGAHFSAPEEFGVFTTLEEINDPANFEKYTYYGMTKFANVLFAKGLASKLFLKNSDNVVATAAHPGMVATGIWESDVALEIVESFNFSSFTKDYIIMPAYRSLQKQIMWTSEEGAWTQTFLAAQATRKDSGKYFHPIAREVEPHKLAKDEKLIKSFWDLSIAVTEGQC